MHGMGGVYGGGQMVTRRPAKLGSEVISDDHADSHNDRFQDRCAVDRLANAGDNSLSARTLVGAPITEEGE
jgi:hypothetical protein